MRLLLKTSVQTMRATANEILLTQNHMDPVYSGGACLGVQGALYKMLWDAITPKVRECVEQPILKKHNVH